MINKVIAKINNYKFASDWLTALSNIKLPQNSEKIYYNKISDCLEENDLQIKFETLISLKNIVEFNKLPDSIQIRMLSCINSFTGEYDEDFISKEAIGSLGIYYSNINVNSELKS